MYLQGLGLQPADTGMKEKRKREEKNHTQREQAQREKQAVIESWRSMLLCRIRLCSDVIVVGWKSRNQLPVGEVVEVGAMKSWKSLALLSVQWNGILLSLRALRP